MTACTCVEHAHVAPATTIGSHTYRCEWRVQDQNDEGERSYERWDEWRAGCSCTPRFRSRWQGQSPNVAYHAWVKHAGQ